MRRPVVRAAPSAPFSGGSNPPARAGAPDAHEREAMKIQSRRSRAALLAAAVIGVLMVVTQMEVDAAGGGHKPPPGPVFGTPVRLPTFEACGGYEPGLAVDH